jgi:hypothetical protein
VKHAKKESLAVPDLETSFSREILRLSVPVTAKPLYNLICVPVLPATKPFSITSAML